MIPNYQDWSDNVGSMMKMRKDDNVTDCTSLLYDENEIELLWPIW